MSIHSSANPSRNVSPLRDNATLSVSNPAQNLIWSDEYHSNYHNEESHSYDLPSPPRAYTTRPSKLQNTVSDTREPRKLQKTFAELLPQFPTFYSPNSRSPSRSPIKEISAKEYEDEFMPTLTGDKENIIKLSDKTRGLSSWFSGSSAPVQMGVPTVMNAQPSSPTRSPQRPSPLRGATNMKENVPLTIPNSSTSLFNKFFSPAAKTPINISHFDDELVNLNINASLFPTGRTENDPFSPAAFDSLLSNAESLLAKMQTALNQRTQALHDLAAEKSAKDEEYEEAEIRARSLKSQLEDMAAQLLEKEALNAELMQALAIEKNARREEAIARTKSIALVREQALHSYQSYSEVDTEDLGFSTPTKKGYRSSYSSSTDFSSDDDGEQVFSRCMSPTASISTYATTGNNSSSSYQQSNVSAASIAEACLARVVQATQPRPTPVRQLSTFERALGKGPREEVVEEKEKLGLGYDSCSNCQGKYVATAWHTVGVLREENKGLKERVKVFEAGIDGALDAVLGLGF